MASPQDAERAGVNASNGYARFKPYVVDTIAKFKDDGRVQWWEIFNEPRQDPYSLGLRNAGYTWAKAVGPAAPVMSCWDDSNNTDIVDHHDYGTAFKSRWSKALYTDPEKGAIVTEGGSRWYQPDPGPATSATTNQADQGSPLTVINFYTALRAEKKAGKRPYVPGGMICWALMVGNDNTRWHWGTAAGSAEPAIPWDAWMFPDGTPISHTEAAAFRGYVNNRNEFLRFNNFLSAAEADGDVTLPLAAGSAYKVPAPQLAEGGASLTPATAVGPLGDALFEATVWAAFPGDGNITMIVRATPLSPTINDYESTTEESTPNKLNDGNDDITQGRGSCVQSESEVFDKTDISGADYRGIDYRTLDVSKAADAVSACTAACCAWDGCAAWIVQSDTDPSRNDHNCTAKTDTCCWLKPNGNGAKVENSKSIAGVVTASPSRPVIPSPAPPPHPGPASPKTHGGYHVVIIGATKTLAVERRDHSGSITTLATFNIASLENGLVLEAWNILRVLTSTSTSKSNGKVVVTISVWFNPMFPETGFVGDSSDAGRTPKPLPARIVVADPSPLPSGEMVLTAGGRDSMVDYASALPAAVH
jgi:hypothetical protein